MNKTPSASKRKTATETAVPAKRAPCVSVPEEVLTLVASSLNAATLALMALPSTDIAARGRVVAVMADCKRRLNNVLGIERRGVSVIAISHVIVDVFHFVRRQELDILQIVSRAFNALVEEKMASVCLRQLNSAKISRNRVERQFVLIVDEVGATEKTRLPIVVDDEAAATSLLFNACRASRVESLQLYGTRPMSVDFFDTLEDHAPTMFVNAFHMGKRTLSDDAPHGKVLRALQAFAELTLVQSEASGDANLQNCLIRTCFKAGAGLVSDLLVLDSNTTIVENALLEFCFGECNEQYATRERLLRVRGPSLEKGFLQRLIELAEGDDGRHTLTLDITVWAGTGVPQDTAGLSAYKQDGQTDEKVRFESVSGRHWSATYVVYDNGRQRLTFENNH